MKTIGSAVAAAAMVVCLSFSAQAQDAPSWCKSKYGPNDEIGAGNLLTPEVAVNAAKLVKTGNTISG